MWRKLDDKKNLTPKSVATNSYQIKQNIYDGTYPIGEKLPSENVLADAFGVSRVPIREALGY
ncbi:winged helix-turn-helix domain-containing protein [Proteus mirabilis]